MFVWLLSLTQAAARRKRRGEGAAPSSAATPRPPKHRGKNLLTRISRRAPAMAPAPVDGGSSCASSSSGTVSRSPSLGGIGGGAGASSLSPPVGHRPPPAPLPSFSFCCGRDREGTSGAPGPDARSGRAHRALPLARAERGRKVGKGAAGVVFWRGEREAVFLVSWGRVGLERGASETTPSSGRRRWWCVQVYTVVAKRASREARTRG